MSCGAWDENRIQYADDAYSAAHLSVAHSLHHQTRWRSAKSWIICAKSSSLMLCAAGMLFSLYLSSIFVIVNTGKPNNCRGALKTLTPLLFSLPPSLSGFFLSQVFRKTRQIPIPHVCIHASCIQNVVETSPERIRREVRSPLTPPFMPPVSYL